jgi:hypothetical protein
MNLGDFSSVANLASNLAVLVSLLFLGLQVRQGNRNQRSLMQQGRSGRNVELLARLSEPNLAKLMSRAAGNEELTDAEYYQLYGYMTSVFWSYEDCFLQFRAGMLDAQSWSSDNATLKRLLANPVYRAVWKAARSALGDDYRSFVDGLASESRSSAQINMANVLRQYIAEERQARE